MEPDDEQLPDTHHWFDPGPPFAITEVVAEAPDSTHPHLLRIVLHLLDPDPDGLARPVERVSTELAVHDVITRLERQLDTWWIAVRETDGQVEIHIALQGLAGWRPHVTTVLQSTCPEHPVDLHLEPNGAVEAWSASRPPQHLLDELPDYARVTRRRLRGDVPEVARAVTITLLLPTADARRELARTLPDQGFKLDDLDEGTCELPFGLDVVAELTLWRVPRAVARLRNLVEPLGGQVGDWGAPTVEVPPSPGLEPSDESVLVGVPEEIRDEVEALVALFRPIFSFYAEDLELGAVFLRAAALENRDDRDLQGFNVGFIARIAALLVPHAGLSAPVAAANVFAAYYLTVTGLLNGQLTSVDMACQVLRQLLEVQRRGW